MNQEHYVITIGRQMGSGGASMGKALAKHFGFQYIDKAILIKSARMLDIPVEKLEWIEEKEFSLKRAFLQSHIYDMPYIPQEWYLPTGRKLFETQSKIIYRSVAESSSVVVGRCGAYLFRDYPKCVSIFLHSDLESRIARLRERHGLSDDEARDYISDSDKERGRYYKTFARRGWLDLTGYDLSIDSSRNNEEQIKQIIIEYIYTRFPELREHHPAATEADFE